MVLTLNLGLHIVDGVRRLHLEGDSLTRKGLDEDLHFDEGLREWSGSESQQWAQLLKARATGLQMERE